MRVYNYYWRLLIRGSELGWAPNRHGIRLSLIPTTGIARGNPSEQINIKYGVSYHANPSPADGRHDGRESTGTDHCVSLCRNR
jgi:hypothetical protein